jgi:hypothetical protein
MLIHCAACGHPDCHAISLAPGSGYPDECESCPFCRAASTCGETERPDPP